MKRISRAVSVLLAIVMCLCGMPLAAAGSVTIGPSSVSDAMISGDFTLKTDSKSYATSHPKITLTFRNTSASVYGFGLSYALEKKTGNTWLACKTDVGWPAIGLVLSAHKTMTHEIEPAPVFGSLDTGTYRVVWEISNEKTNRRYVVYAEFEIRLPANSPPVTKPGAAVFQTMMVTDTANVYFRASGKSKVTDQLSKGQTVEVVGETNGWPQIRWYDGGMGNTGFVSPRYLKKSGPVICYTKEPVNLRSSAAVSNNLLFELGAGEAVTLLKQDGDWSLVSYKGTKGYVYKKYLTQNRAECYFSHPVVSAIGKKNIKAVAYTYAPKPLADINTSVVSLIEVNYSVRMQRKDNSLVISTYRYDSEKTALWVRGDISRTQIYPDWTRTFYQKGDTVVCFDLKGLEFSKSEYRMIDRIRSAIQAQYGEPIQFL